MNEVATTQGGTIVPYKNQAHHQVIEAKDIDIPNIFVVQSNSTAALERDIPAGSLAGAGGSKVFSKAKETWQFVPIGFRRVWDIYKVVGPDKVEWLEQTPYTPDNSNAPWEWTEGKDTFSRKQKLHVIGMDREAIEKEASFLEKIAKGEEPDLDDFSFPVCLSLKGASMKTAGKTVFTHFSKVDTFNSLAPETMQKPYHCRFLKATTSLETKDSNKFFVINLENGEMLSPAHIKVLDKWAQTLNSANVNVQDAEVSEGGTDIPF